MGAAQNARMANREVPQATRVRSIHSGLLLCVAQVGDRGRWRTAFRAGQHWGRQSALRISAVTWDTGIEVHEFRCVARTRGLNRFDSASS